MGILCRTYQGPQSDNCAILIRCLSRASTKSFIRRYDSQQGKPYRIFTDIIVNIYSQFLSDNVEAFSDRELVSASRCPPLVKLLKLRIMEEKILLNKWSWGQIFDKYYKPIYEQLVSDKNGDNHHYLTLSILHEYIEDSPA